MREELIAYALGELDESARQRVEQAVAADPALASELDRIQQCLTDIGEAAHPQAGLPRGLADRTAEQVLSCCESTVEQPPGKRSSSAAAAIGDRASQFSLLDMTVVGGVILTLGCLIIPALSQQRSEARRIACQNNLHELGTHLTIFSEKYGNYYPLIRPNEHAGMYSVWLLEAEIMSKDELSRRVVCVASPLAEELASQGKDLYVPTAAELAQARGRLLVRFRRTSGGSYGYQIGWIKGDKYLPARNNKHCQVPVLADAPNVESERNCGANHSGCVINVLFRDGTVQSFRNCVVSCAKDHFFLNDEGKPIAGKRWNDSMVAPSDSTPGVDQQVPQRINEIFPDLIPNLGVPADAMLPAGDPAAR
ncbi:MAG: hypothetical protein ACR2NU_14510 [Aeoliella sp.]